MPEFAAITASGWRTFGDKMRLDWRKILGCAWTGPSVAAVTAALSSHAFAAALHVPIMPGDYALEGYTCLTAPLAGLMHYDGQNFSGPHDRDCVTAVQTHEGDTFTVATTCNALGDGTPAAPSTVVESYKVLSSERVIKILPASAGGNLVYLRCSRPAK